MRARQSKTPNPLPAGGRLWCAGLALLLLALTTHSEQLPVKTYTTGDGLPRNSISHIFSDSRGSLWICTGDGLSFFNGYEFVTYGLKEGLPHTYINDIIEDRRGVLWVATNGGGVCEFNPYAASAAARRFVVHQIGGTFATNRVNVLYEDRAGRLWAATDDGVFRLDHASGQTEFRPVESPLAKAGGEPNNNIFTFAEDREGSLWIGGILGLARLLPDGRALHYSSDSGLTTVRKLLTDRAGRIWVSQVGGILVINPEPVSAMAQTNQAPWRKLTRQSIEAGAIPASNSPTLPQSPGEACQFSSTQQKEPFYVWGLLEAKDGRVWITGNSGLSEFDGRSFKSYTMAEGLTTNSLTSLAEDRDGNLWIGSSEGVLKITLNSFTRFAEKEGLKGKISSVMQDRAGNLLVTDDSNSPKKYGLFDGRRFTNIAPRYPAHVYYFGWSTGQLGLQHASGEWWITTGMGLGRFPAVRQTADLAHLPPKAFYTTQDGLHANDIFQIFEDSRGDVWIGGYSPTGCLTRWERTTETFHVYGRAAGLPVSNGASGFCEDRFGNLWIGFYEGGLARYTQGRFSFFTTADGVPGFRIKALHLDRHGRLWVGSDTAGVARLDDTSAARPRFSYYTTDQGLAANNIISITEDLLGRIYLGHTRGVDRLEPESGAIRHYTAADGLLHEITTAYCDRAGALWFGTFRGLYRLIPPPDRAAQPPPILINKLRIEGRAYPIAETGETRLANLELAASQNQVEVGFYGLGFRAGESLRYQYKLEGADQDWSPLSTQRTVRFARLAPGAYQFLVRAVNADGKMSAQAATLSFTILYPIWQRWWFLALVSLTLGLAGYTGYRYRIAQLLAVERLRTHISSDLHDDIGANLARITILSEVAKQQLGQRGNGQVTTPLPDDLLSTIAGISRESVAAMRDIVWAINPQRDNLRDLTRKLREHAEEVFTLREIALCFSAPDERQQLKLPVDVRRDLLLFFKEAINNAARHSACQRVEIDLGVVDSTLNLRIADDGVGFDPATASEGNGLASMQRRARNLRGALSLEAQPGQGTTIRLTIPLPRKLAGI